MTQPLNIYALSRIRDEDDFNLYRIHSSGRDDGHRTGLVEIYSLRDLADALYSKGVTVSQLDDFYYGYIIPHIGKEFDLLRITESHCLNIELKSEAVPAEQIRAQLVKNKYYLNYLGKRLELYTVVTDTMSCYRLSLADELLETDISELIAAIGRTAGGCLRDIDDMFRPSNYLVSLARDPDKFLQGEYFLTQMQDQIKKELLASAEDCFSGAFFNISGDAGTGKTLLLYDIAKAFSHSGRTLVLHCGKLSAGQIKISDESENLDILPVSVLDGEGSVPEGYHFLLVDEAQHLSPRQFAAIKSCAEGRGMICVFSTDPGTELPGYEKAAPGLIRELDLRGEYELSEKIRMNREIHSYIMRMLDLGYEPKGVTDSHDISLCFANNEAEAEDLLEYFRDDDYEFIDYARVIYRDEGPEPGDEETAQECDRVVMILDNMFYYDERGRLQIRQDTDPAVLTGLYRGLMRTRDKLALIVVRNFSLFDTLMNILEKREDI